MILWEPVKETPTDEERSRYFRATGSLVNADSKRRKWQLSRCRRIMRLRYSNY